MTGSTETPLAARATLPVSFLPAQSLPPTHLCLRHTINFTEFIFLYEYHMAQMVMTEVSAA